MKQNQSEQWPRKTPLNMFVFEKNDVEHSGKQEWKDIAVLSEINHQPMRIGSL
jgi:hypothetical protein